LRSAEEALSFFPQSNKKTTTNQPNRTGTFTCALRWLPSVHPAARSCRVSPSTSCNRTSPAQSAAALPSPAECRPRTTHHRKSSRSPRNSPGSTAHTSSAQRTDSSCWTDTRNSPPEWRTQSSSSTWHKSSYLRSSSCTSWEPHSRPDTCTPDGHRTRSCCPCQANSRDKRETDYRDSC